MIGAVKLEVPAVLVDCLTMDRNSSVYLMRITQNWGDTEAYTLLSWSQYAST